VVFDTGTTAHKLATAVAASNLPAFIVDARAAAPFLRAIKSTKTDSNDAFALT
jgi:hypothetical protein